MDGLGAPEVWLASAGRAASLGTVFLACGLRAAPQHSRRCRNWDQSTHEKLPLLGGNIMASARIGAHAGKLLGFMVGSKKRSLLMVAFSLMRVKELEVGSLRSVKNM